MKNNNLLMTIEMEVDTAQAIALTSMFNYWTLLGETEESKTVSFFVDGSGNFKPNCKITTSEPLPPLLQNAQELFEIVNTDDEFDYDNVYKLLSENIDNTSAQLLGVQ